MASPFAAAKGVGTILNEVQLVGVQPDNSELPRVFKPGRSLANAEGFVTMPNIVVSNQTVDLIVASRA